MEPPQGVYKHAWELTVGDNKTDVYTCAKCGLVQITNLSGQQFFFAQINEQFTACPSPYRERG
jgi:hypothetical protein